MMEQLKVRRKDMIIGSMVVYLILSFIFLYLQYAYRHHLSPFSLMYFKKSTELFWYVALPLVISALMVWRLSRFARASFALASMLVGFKVVEGLFIEFNKIIVIALFFYSVISYFLYQLLDEYLRKASINPNYSPNDLFGPLLSNIPCTVKSGETEFIGYLTNWDEEGCFLKFDAPHVLIRRPQVIVHFQGRDFLQLGEVVAHTVDFTGFGIKFTQSSKDLKIFNWAEFMEIAQELGFQPERLR